MVSKTSLFFVIRIIYFNRIPFVPPFLFIFSPFFAFCFPKTEQSSTDWFWTCSGVPQTPECWDQEHTSAHWLWKDSLPLHCIRIMLVLTPYLQESICYFCSVFYSLSSLCFFSWPLRYSDPRNCQTKCLLPYCPMLSNNTK